MTKFSVNVERIPLFTSEVENPLLNMLIGYVNSSGVQELLLNSFELEIVKERNYQRFENKHYHH